MYISRLSRGDESVPQKHQFHLGITGLLVENKIWVSGKKTLNVIFLQLYPQSRKSTGQSNKYELTRSIIFDCIHINSVRTLNLKHIFQVI